MRSAKELYEEVKKVEEDVRVYKNTLASKETEYKECIHQYRIKSVDRVLDFIRTEYRAGRVCNLETLLCHCQNKLLGNIDGVELSLDESYEGVKIGKEALRKGV